MTACSKCGAENPDSNEFCARCEMPLPHRGVGGTLTGGSPGGRGGANAHQETLFGLAPDKLFGALAARQQAPTAPPPELPRPPVSPAPAAPPRAVLGSPASPTDRPARSPAPAGLPPAMDAPLPNRTLVGVMADDVRPFTAPRAASAHTLSGNPAPASPAPRSPAPRSPLPASPLPASPLPASPAPEAAARATPGLA